MAAIPVAGAPLWPQQREVLRLRALGLDVRAVARRMRLSEHTVRHYYAAAYRQLGASCLADALRALGWLRVPGEEG